MVEEGIEVDGKALSKGDEAHKATVVGDTVGDPFKDTSGPSLNILLKLMSVVALVIAPSIAVSSVNTMSNEKEVVKEITITDEVPQLSPNQKVEKEVMVEIVNDETTVTIVTNITDDNGEVVTTEEILKGEEAQKFLEEHKSK
jgi:K(+)-stimulated pyrophosphate-energized sodium pump